jgi:DNA-binding Lrp family transcriptional regulator
VDTLDARLLRELDTDCRVGILELSRRLSVARPTVQARIEKLRANGVISSFSAVLDTEALGYTVTAFVSLEIRQRRDAEVIAHLRGVPEVLEVFSITGQGDLLCRIVARSNADLQRVIDDVVASEAILRTSSSIALTTRLPYRATQLIDAVAEEA